MIKDIINNRKLFYGENNNNKNREKIKNYILFS